MKSIANTTIRFGMIALPAQVCAATESQSDVTFGQASPSGEKLRQAYLDPNSNEVPRDDIVKGVWDGPNFRPVDKTAIEAIAEATKIEDLSILEVIPKDAFDPTRITGKYFIQSHKKSGNKNAFKLFVDALEANGQAVVTKWTARSRQKLMVMFPEDGVLVGVTLSFAGDIRVADEAVLEHASGSYQPAELEMAQQLLNGMAADNPTALATQEDEAIALKGDLIAKALDGQAITVSKPAQAAEAVDSLANALDDMLKQQAAEKELREKVA